MRGGGGWRGRYRWGAGEGGDRCKKKKEWEESRFWKQGPAKKRVLIETFKFSESLVVPGKKGQKKSKRREGAEPRGKRKR